MRRLRKQPVACFNPWDLSREVGDRVFCPQSHLECAYMYDLVESNGRKSTDGELIPRLVKKNGIPRRAVIGENDIWYWE